VSAETLTWQRLREVRCSELEDAADGWGKASNGADGARRRVQGQMLARIEASQRGEAAQAAGARLRVLGGDFQYIYTECGLVRTTLNGLAHDLRAQQRALLGALDDARSLRFTVNDDGSVSYPEAGEGAAGTGTPAGGTAPGAADFRFLLSPEQTSPNPNAAKAQEIADRIARAVAEAAEIDARCVAALRKLTARDGLRVTTADWKDASGDATRVRALADDYLKDAIPWDKSPAERKAWWFFGLTQEQREEYLAVYPDQIGNLDGIPAEVRDRANRDNLSLLMGKLAGEDDERARTQLAGLRSIDRQLRAGSEPPMYLLGIGDEGNGRAIVSYGNPDTARNVSAYVPGLGTALDEEFAANDLKRARDTAWAAQKYDASSAAIVWLGYDAPQLPDGDSLMGNVAVMSTERAEAGALAYNRFMGGLAATNENEDVHLTAIGHSYGSRTVGAAAVEEGGIPGVNDIILVGSPGVGVDRAEDLGIGKEHVFVGAADNDPVTHLPSGGRSVEGAAVAIPVVGPFISDGVAALADPEDDDLWFGKDPASEAFGARRFEVDDGPRPFVDGEGATPAHSNYFSPVRDPVSTDNIGQIVSGHPGEIKSEEWR
jgi:hypothetical protein